MPSSSRSLKVVVIGDADAGKTALRGRYLTRSFQPAYRATIGADFVAKTVEVTIPVPGHEHRQSQSKATESAERKSALRAAAKQGRSSTSTALASADEDDDREEADGYTRSRQEKVRITMSIWDTAGQERFKSLGSAFYRGADAAIIAFDVTKRGALERAQTWYRDFCSLGDLGLDEDDERLAKSNPRQAREARENRQKFCWVAVGCKGDLLSELTRQHSKGNRAPVADSSEDNFHGTKWSDARSFLDRLLPRYMPQNSTEKNAFKEQDENLQASSKPYDIEGQAPARPEDVLSRPSPQNGSTSAPRSIGDSHTLPDNAGRHPEAGTPPGSTANTGLDERRLPATPNRMRETSKRKGKSSRRSIDVWQPERTSETQANTQDSLHRSRYNSTTSLGAPSVYYSVRGDSAIFGPSSSKTGLASTSSSATAHAQQKREEESSMQDDETETGSRKDDRDLKITRRRAGRSSTAQSSKTIKQEHQVQSIKGHPDVDDSDDSPTAISAIPSGDPIPFPSEDDDLEETLLYDQDSEALHRRYRHISRMSTPRSRSRHDDRGASRSRKVSQVAAAAKADQQIQEAQNPHIAEESDKRRMTLYSAPPSECASTIRAADEDLTASAVSISRGKEPMDAAAQDGTTAANADLSSSPPSSLHDSEYEADEGELFEAAHVERGFGLFYTSAKDDVGIDDVFDHIARRVAINWAYDEWDEARRRRLWGYSPDGAVRTAPPADEERERERMRRAIRISTGKGTGDCCW